MQLWSDGVRDFAVATLPEAFAVREALPDAGILVLMGCSPGEESSFLRYRLTASVFDSRQKTAAVPSEVKIDTGMTRAGVAWKEAHEFIAGFQGKLVGVFSHFSSADDDDEITRIQLGRFQEATRGLNLRRHISNSAGLRFSDAHLDAVRPGLALYGIAPCPEVADVEPILEWKTRILTVRPVPAGTPIGYNGTFVTRRDSQIAVLPVGYADGYSRGLSNRGSVRIGGRLAPVVGRVSMDLTTVDVSDIPTVSPGDEAVLLEADPGSPISAAGLAEMLGTIPYEVLTSIGPRVERVYTTE